MDPELVRNLVDRVSTAIDDNAENLSALDRAIGDGDHGINMKRGFDAVRESRDTLADLPLSEVLQKAGMTLVMTVGGASGPLYGSFLMAMGKALQERAFGVGDIAIAMNIGVEAVKQRGKSDVGEKTMLDVLGPVAEVFRSTPADSVAIQDLLSRLRATADQGLEATRDMKATKGRASFLGERSIGHLDPGAAVKPDRRALRLRDRSGGLE